MKNSTSIRAVACALLLATGVCHAQGYLTVQIGASSPDDDTVNDGHSLLFGGGAHINENFSLEAAYMQLGKFDANAYGRQIVSSYVGYPTDYSIKVSGPTVGAAVHAPFTDNFSAFARFGLFLWDSDVDVTVSGAGSASDGNSGNDPYYGAGLEVKLNEQTSVTAGYTQYKADDVDISNISAGLSMTF